MKKNISMPLMPLSKPSKGIFNQVLDEVINNKILTAIILFLGSLFLFTDGLFSEEIIGFESRFYLFALEMWRHGLTFFPTTYGKSYPDYPGTAIFCIYCISHLFGGLNKFSAVFPSAMAAAMTLSFTYLIGALHSRRWGFYAVLCLLLTQAFMMEARTISLDQYTTAVTTLCFYHLYASSLAKHKPRLVLLGFLFLVGFAFRGPIGLIIPAAVSAIFLLLDRNLKQFFSVVIMAACALILGSSVLFALAYHVGGIHFVQAVLHMQVLGRMEAFQTPPFYFYAVESLGAYALTYPLVLLIVIGLIFRPARLDKTILLKLLAWILVILIGLSIPADKKIRYILPIAPALALMTAYGLVYLHEGKYFQYLRLAVNSFFFIFPLVCLGFVGLSHFRYKLQLHYFELTLFFIILQILAFCVVRWFKEKNFCLLVIAVATFYISYVDMIEPINLFFNRTQAFVLRVEQLRHQQQAGLAFYQEASDGLAIKYLANMPTDASTIFINKPDDLLRTRPSLFYIVSEEHFAQMPSHIRSRLQVKLQGNIGHEKVIVFSRS